MTKEDSINYLIDELKRDTGLDTNLIRDGYHSFGELYEHRIVLYIVLCHTWGGNPSNVWRSKYHSDGKLIFDGKWFILGIFKDPGDQITYHLPIEKWDETDFAFTIDKAPEWDGHTPEDVLKRIKKLYH